MHFNMRNLKKSKSSKKEKKSKKIIPEKLSLEKEVKDKIEIIPIKEEIPEKDFMDELDANGIISSVELNQILKSEKKLVQFENIPVGTSLEGGLIFAPRMKDRKDAEGKIYSDMKYDKIYMENKYGEKTPGMYAEKETSSKKESSNGSDSNGKE